VHQGPAWVAWFHIFGRSWRLAYTCSDSSDSIDHVEHHWSDDDDCVYPSPDWQGGNYWYRIMPPAGVVIPESSPESNHCGTMHGGWIHSGTHPTNEGEQVTVEVCFSFDNGNGDDCRQHKNILVTNCISYYVYYLPNVPFCGARYCAADNL